MRDKKIIIIIIRRLYSLICTHYFTVLKHWFRGRLDKKEIHLIFFFGLALRVVIVKHLLMKYLKKKQKKII